MAFAAALLSGALALAVACRKRWSIATVCFCAGMVVLAVNSILSAFASAALLPERSADWLKLSLIARSFLPGIWLTFSLSYSRGNFREFFRRWRIVLAAAFLVPIGLAIGCQRYLVEVVSGVEPGIQWIKAGEAGLIWNVVYLIGIALILMNLERTFRAAVGTMRWRIKFLVLGLAVIFGTQIYTRSQVLIFAGFDRIWMSIDSLGLLVGCLLMTIGYLRKGFEKIDVYPSREVLQRSLTVLLLGGYLFIVGVLAQFVTVFGGADSFPIQAAFVLLATTALAVLLLSDRARQGMQQFVSRHFKRPQHNPRKIWTQLSQSTSSVLDRTNLCTATGRLIAETFNVLSVNLWLFEEETQRFQLGSSTARTQDRLGDFDSSFATTASVADRLRQTRDPFDLDRSKEGWMAPLKELVGADFPKGGHRICVPLVVRDRVVGMIILADRVNGVAYTVEEMDLLRCIGDQFAANLLNLRMAGDLMAARELEAFQTMSAFFVHDLKNTASSMNLMLQNLPNHFDDPEFRKDALRAIGNSVKRINTLIERLSAFRQNLEIRPVKFDLNELVNEAIASLNGNLRVELVKDLHPLPFLMADREQIRSVVTNLLLNAGEAMSGGGVIRVETGPIERYALLTVMDNGCGMRPEFVKDSLFRPFRSTKKKGLGIGMFQSKMIVEAHRGSIQVESEPGKGTTFRVRLPVAGQVSGEQ